MVPRKIVRKTPEISHGSLNEALTLALSQREREQEKFSLLFSTIHWVTAMKCYEYFLRLLSRREYSIAELQKKAQEKGFLASDIATALEQVQSYDYQSDRRLVSSLIAASQGKYGKTMIWRKCYQKGIDRDLFAEIWQEAIAEEDSRINNWDELREKVKRRYKVESFQQIDPKTKNKIANFLQYRGFKSWELLALWQQDEN